MRGLSSLLLLLVLISWGNSSYIHLKAELAQVLIANAWQANQSKPWPWADHRPVAKLSFKGEEAFVLSGGQGSSLAFGPGHVDGTALPGRAGTSVVVGHRDTHFEFLQDLERGNEIMLESMDRVNSSYAVTDIEIIDTRDSEIYVYDMNKDMLILMTCYPFDAVDPGGPLRYVVKAALSN